MKRLPFETIPIDDAARDGRFQLVFQAGRRFALVRWRADRWEFSSGAALDFEPTHYNPRRRS